MTTPASVKASTQAPIESNGNLAARAISPGFIRSSSLSFMYRKDFANDCLDLAMTVSLLDCSDGPSKTISGSKDAARQYSM
jgi:hypothetical protein